MGGLLRYALDNHNGFIISDQDSIGSGAGRLDQAQSTDSFDRLVPFPSEVSFGCRVRSTLSNPSEAVRAILSRTVVVVARGLTAESIDNEQLRGQPDEDPQFDPVPMEKKTNTGTVVSRRLADLARSLGWKAWNCFLLTLPPSNWVEKVVPRGIHAEIERADTVLLLAPALRRGEKPPAGTRAYSDICASYAYRIDIDIVLVPIEVNRVLDTEDENRDGDMLKRTLRSRVGINSDRCEVVPVNRFYGGEYRGFGELLEKTGA
jgi:hypothetical protein